MNIIGIFVGGSFRLADGGMVPEWACADCTGGSASVTPALNSTKRV